MEHKQAADKYLKAFLFYQGQSVRERHSLRQFLNFCCDHEPSLKELTKSAKELDKVYYSSRYPDALADDIPADYYTEEDAIELLEYANTIRNKILEYVQ